MDRLLFLKYSSVNILGCLWVGLGAFIGDACPDGPRLIHSATSGL